MEKIGKFDVIELLGRGAMGVVYKGRDPALARHVAVKVMTAHLEMDPELRARFFREAQAAGSLQHPNIITVYELGDASGQPYIAMEFIPGRDLDDIIAAREPLTVVEKVDIIEQVCRGLAYAHERHIVHRDVKPANIRVTEMGQVKLMDFGVAHLISSDLTQTGSLMGTPYYMAPEVVNGHPVDVRADIFSLGATFYELVSYSRPFQGESLQTVFHKILHSDPAPLRELGLDVPPVVQRVLDRSLAKSPSDRYADTGEFLNDLMQFWETLPAPAQARVAATTAIGAAAAKAAGRARRRWKATRLIPRAVGAAVAIAGLMVVGGAVVWPMLFQRNQAPVERSVTDQAPAGQVGNDAVSGEESGMPPLAMAADSTDIARESESDPTDSAGQPAASEPEPAAERAPQPEALPQTQPVRRPTPDRRPFDSAHEAANEARDRAVEAGAAQLAVEPFRRAENLRQEGLDAAGSGRYDAAARQMRQAGEVYEEARSGALAAWRTKLDSARADLGVLREAADSSAGGFARAEQLRRQGETAERSNDYAAALSLLARAADAYRLAAKPVVSEPEPEEEREAVVERSPEQIVAETLGELRQAIESENLTALQRVWIGLSADQLTRFENFFGTVTDLKVTFAVRSLERSTDRLNVTVETTYDSLNEDSRRRESSTFRQFFELAERGGRWVIVGSRS